MGKRYIITLSLLMALIIIFFFANSQGQDGGRAYAAETEYASVKDCINRFNIKDALSQLPSEDQRALLNYLSCMAISGNDISCCDDISNSKDRERCFKEFTKYQGFLLKLLFEKSINPDLIRSCVTSRIGNIEACKGLAEAFTKGDDALCAKLVPPVMRDICRAMVKLDEALVSDRYNKDMILFLKAARDFNPSECKKINNESLKIRCKAYTMHDTAICQECSDFKALRNRFCNKQLQERR